MTVETGSHLGMMVVVVVAEAVEGALQVDSSFRVSFVHGILERFGGRT